LLGILLDRCAFQAWPNKTLAYPVSQNTLLIAKKMPFALIGRKAVL
jgi:hypothetical protein